MPGDWTGLGDRHDMKGINERLSDRFSELIGIVGQMFIMAFIMVIGTVILRWLFRLLIL